MKNYYNTYVALKNIIIDNNGISLKINQFDELELKHYTIDNNQKFYKCLYNDNWIMIPEADFNKSFKVMIELYQEQFSHLNKEYSYFGQISIGKSFIIEENGKTKYYQKIGEYITRNGNKYNVVELKNYNKYFNPIEIEDYSHVVLEYFENDKIINTEYSTNFEGIIKKEKSEEKRFLPIQSLKICESIVYDEKMLEVIDCFFSNKELSIELQEVYKKYQEYKEEEEYLGFTAYNNKHLEEIMLEINNKNILKKFKM